MTSSSWTPSSTAFSSPATSARYSAIREQSIVPEINYDEIAQVRGLDVAITTTTESDEEARALLVGLGFPFASEDRS